MITILFINFVVLIICQTLDKKTIQPYGPKMCENLNLEESSYTARLFDGVQLECKLVSNTSSLNLSGNPSSQLDVRVYDINNQSTSTKNNSVAMHEKSDEKATCTTHSVRRTVQKKRRICSPGSVERLFKAIQDGRLIILKRLLSRGMLDVDCRGAEGQTPVMEAAILKENNIFDYLVLHKCDLSAVDQVNDTVLHYACSGGSKYIVKKLLDDHNIDIDSRGQVGMSPLMSIIYDGNIQMFKFLLKRGADIRIRDNDNNTVIHTACELGNRRKVIFILSLNAIDIECRGSSGRTPLVIAVYNGHLHVVKLLMNRGADVNTVDDKTNNILHVACHVSNVNVVKYVLSLKKAEIDRRGYLGRTPFMQAVENGHTAVVRLLRRRGANIKMVDDVNNTILHLACVSGRVDMVKYVLSLKIHDIDCLGKFGRTPLMGAVEHRHAKVVRFLIKQKKADLTTTDQDGMNVLHIACVAGQFDMIKYLVTLKELIGFEKMKNKAGDTPIQMAMKKRHLDIVSFLKSKE